jgi:hypothetical protein
MANHTFPSNDVSKEMHVVLDFYHVENPIVDLCAIPYEVFVVVKKSEKLFVSPRLTRNVSYS